ncbi:MAG: AAA family ATPase [Candidatus Krumholzibacteriota bacterium]
MSKIFDAYRKKVGGLSDLSLEIGKAGSISLYPSPTGSQKDDFNKLANRLLGLRLENRGTILTFGSSATGEGASFVSYNTAMYLASVYHQKVVWIDANFMAPQTKLLGQDRNTFSFLLQNPDKVDDLVASDNPLLIAGGGNLQDARGLLADRKFGQLLSNLAHRFDFVILDLPPVLNSTDTALMAAGSDGFLLVIEQKFLKVEVIEHGIQGLRDKGVHMLGTVINRRTFDLPKVIYDRI